MICLEVQDSKGNKRNCTDVPFTDWSTGKCKLGVFLGLWHGSACVVCREIGPIQYGHKVIKDIGTCNYYSWLFFLGGGKSWSPHPLVWQSALYLFCRASPIQFPFGSRGFSKLGTLISPNFGKPLVWGLGTLKKFRHAFFRILILTLDHHFPLENGHIKPLVTSKTCHLAVRCILSGTSWPLCRRHGTIGKLWTLNQPDWGFQKHGV